jgi:hypothetical protein
MVEPRKHPKPSSYDELYPGRFVKAADLKGKKVTVTIADVDLEDLEDETGAQKTKCIISFRESPKKLVACKTNGLCVRDMFGPQIAQWLGKRITLFESTWNNEPAIRVWGSPDIPADLDVTVTLPRRRPFKMTMHAMGSPKSVAQSTELDRGLDEPDF